ncbi:MAG: cisplatin damage response ATP-dependent DNA ligase [Alphaproteobacteria bacterium]
MKAFAALLDALSFEPSRTAKIRLLADYFGNTPDPHRGYGLAALTGELVLRTAKPKLIRELACSRVDELLFRLSYDFVGDLAETAALIWPIREQTEAPPVPALADVVESLNAAGRVELPGRLAAWLDVMSATERWALLKLITGGLRVGVSARLAKSAVAELGRVDVGRVEEVWHALEPPYTGLFAWLEGRGPYPEIGPAPAFRPLMLANPLDDSELATMDPAAFLAEWKWDGVRVQLVSVDAGGGGLERRIYSRTGDDIGAAFPEIVAAMDFDAVVDGELLVARDGEVAPFAELQPRLGRKAVSAAILARHPAHVRLYDILFEDGEDLRTLAFEARRTRLEAWYRSRSLARMDLSPLVAFSSWDELARHRDDARAAGNEGLMLKRRDSAYVSGRPKGPWFKWKRDPLVVDAVLMYAQRGHGKRSSYYSDYTFGCWRAGEGGDEIVPVGKAYFGFTDAELRKLDRWIRNNTVARFGPVREVRRALVFEVAFDSVQPSKRHKSGLALRFPRIKRIRWDKPAVEADRLETLAGMIESRSLC